ncbi:unnamed protein product [Brassica oleracea]
METEDNIARGLQVSQDRAEEHPPAHEKDRKVMALATLLEDEKGIEETHCTARIHENIDDPERSDFFSTRAGRISTLNSLNLPVPRLVRLNAIRGVLYSGGMMLPHRTANAHTVLYVTGGQAKIQVVDDNVDSVQDERQCLHEHTQRWNIVLESPWM